MQFKGTGSLLLKDLDTKQGIVSAYWSAIGNRDDGGDIVMPNCWQKSIKERGPKSNQPRIKFLYQHDEKMLVAKPSELVEDGSGLLATYTIPPTTLGKDVLILYEYGVISEHSVGYETVLSQWDSKSSSRLLVECVLWEGSAVTWGMNSETPTVLVKSLVQPGNILAIADRAQKLDKLLHDGNLRSDALCQTLERELKSLHAVLAPSREQSQPYSIKGVLDSMTQLAQRLQTKKATGKTSWPLGDRKAAWDNGAAHKRIVEWATKEDGSLDTAKMSSVHFYTPDGDDAKEESKYKLLFCDVESGNVKAMPRALFACAGSHGVDATSGVSDEDKSAIKKKLTTYYHRMADEFDDDSIESPFEGKAATTTRLIKGTGGDIEVSEDGTHGAYTGDHEHNHKAFDSQGDDDQHGHKHSHKGNADHNHDHEKASAMHHASKDRRSKARDFSTLFASMNASDQLQDDWGDTFIAFTRCMEELMWQNHMVNAGYASNNDDFDLTSAAQANIDAFSTALLDLIDRSAAADFCPVLDYDCDQFLDPDGVNANETSAYDDDDYYKSDQARRAQKMPNAPAKLRKEGRVISGATRNIITDALDGMSEAMKSMKAHHGTMVDLLEKTDPDHTRQDEDTALGIDDSENGGTNPNKGHAPERHTDQAATTHKSLDDDLSALRSRKK